MIPSVGKSKVRCQLLGDVSTTFTYYITLVVYRRSEADSEDRNVYTTWVAESIYAIFFGGDLTANCRRKAPPYLNAAEVTLVNLVSMPQMVLKGPRNYINFKCLLNFNFKVQKEQLSVIVHSPRSDLRRWHVWLLILIVVRFTKERAGYFNCAVKPKLELWTRWPACN